MTFHLFGCWYCVVAYVDDDDDIVDDEDDIDNSNTCINGSNDNII